MISGPQLKLMVRHTALVLNNAAKIYGTIFGAYEASVGMGRGIRRINNEFRARKAHGQRGPNISHGRDADQSHTTTDNGHLMVPSRSE